MFRTWSVSLSRDGLKDQDNLLLLHFTSAKKLAKELEDVQKQFEAYRTEMGVDSTRLREETLSAQREVTKLSTALAKANAQIEVLAGE